MLTDIWTTTGAVSAGDVVVYPQHIGKSWEILSGDMGGTLPANSKAVSCLETGELTYSPSDTPCIKVDVKAISV